MNNPNLFYEATDISTPSEVREAYEHSVKNNIKYYRAISKANHGIYGWDERKGQYIMVDSAIKNAPQLLEQIEGSYWFVNGKYTDLQQEVLKPISETAELKIVNQQTEEEEDTPYVVDYKALYERILPKYNEAKKSLEGTQNYKKLFEDSRECLTNKTAEYDKMKESYTKLRNAQAKTITAIDDILEDVNELKADISSIKNFNLE